MALAQLIIAIRRWWWLLIVCAGIAGGVGYFLSQAQTPVYRATSRLLVIEDGTSSDGELTSLRVSERLALSYAERLRNRRILEEAIANVGVNLSPNRLRNNMSVNVVRNTQLIELSVEHSDPQVARDLANEVPAVFVTWNSSQQMNRFAELSGTLASELEEVEAELLLIEMAINVENDRETPNEATLARLLSDAARVQETYDLLARNYDDIRVAELRSLDTLIIDEPASEPQSPIRPRTTTNTIIAFLSGGFFAALIIGLFEYLDDTIHDIVALRDRTGVEILASVPSFDIENSPDALIVAKKPRAPISETYRKLRTAVQFSAANNSLATILVTSSSAGEGKTTTAANLAITLAQAGKRVVLVDADLRRPTLHRLLERKNRFGLSNVFIGTDEYETLLQETAVENLRFIASGPLPPNPAELLGGERMDHFVAWLKEQADCVVFDSPPVLAVTDSVVLSRLANITLVITRIGQTRYPAVQATLEQLRSVDSHIAGIVANQLTPVVGGKYLYSYYYQQTGYYTSTEEA